MDRSKILFGVLILAAVSLFVWGFVFGEEEPDKASLQDAGEQVSTESTVKVNSEGSVEVTAEPVSIGREDELWAFRVYLDTHSVDLDEDMADISVLVDGAGNEHRPVSWDGDPAGGHHRSGELLFEPPAEYPEAVELVIKNVGGVEERRFKW